MAENALNVEMRSGVGKGVARKLRAAGRIPGVCYGSEATPTPISVDPKALRKLLMESDAGMNTLIDVKMPGGGLNVVSHLESDPNFDGRLVLMTGALATDPQVQVGPDVVRIQKPFRFEDLLPVVEG